MRAIFLILFVACFSNKPLAQDSLDGRSYQVEIKEQNASGEIDNWEDKIYFKAGAVSAGFAEKNKFKPALYALSVSPEGTGCYFSGTFTTKKGITLTWSGIIIGDKISGQAVQSDTGTIYYFEGTQQL